jgi:glycine/D-amino acid oxidase-like deaminating enzyme
MHETGLKFQKLDRDINVDILIVGGGISGTLCAYTLSSLGLSVAVAEKGRTGSGSTAAQTGLLMYKSDRMLQELAVEIGEEKAVLFYRMCLEAMEQLNSIGGLLGAEAEYRLRDSIYYASSENDAAKLEREYELLSKHSFPAELLGRDELKARYGIDKACALRTWSDADMNPSKFLNTLVKRNVENGVRYFENTEIDLEGMGPESAFTADGRKISFRHIVLATGYSQVYPVIRDKCRLTRTYAFCSEPVSAELWGGEAMVWETKLPYLYFRTTADRRIVGGGLDEEADELERDPERIAAKAERLAEEIGVVVQLAEIKVSHAWNAIFAVTRDGIPFIGRDPDNPNRYYLLGFEGNGTCYSTAGSMIISELIQGKKNRYQEIVRPDR